MRYARNAAVAFRLLLEVLALAIFNPLAGLFLAIQTWAIKYTSEIMVEAVPSLMSLLAVLFYMQARRRSVFARGQGAAGWWLFSGVALGLTVASKYIYCVAGIAYLVDTLWQLVDGEGPMVDRDPVRTPDPAGQQASANHQPFAGRHKLTALGYLLLWGVVALTVFWAANPRLWADPLRHLTQSVSFHGPFAADSGPGGRHPVLETAVLAVCADPLAVGHLCGEVGYVDCLLAGAGIARLWQTTGDRIMAGHRCHLLLLWPAKWPQYMKTVSAPLCLAAAAGFRGLLSLTAHLLDARSASACMAAAALSGVPRRIALRPGTRRCPARRTPCPGWAAPRVRL